MRYQFISGVLNMKKGENGYHSIALSCERGDYYIYNDDDLRRKVGLKEVHQHPKLLFYRKL